VAASDHRALFEGIGGKGKSVASGNPEILMLRQMMPTVVRQLDAAFTVHKLWEAGDRDAFLAPIASRIRAIAIGGGHVQLDGAFMSRFPKLETISSFGVGYDDIDAKWAGEHGIIVTNTPDVLNEEVADTALGLLLCTVRQFPQAERYVRAGQWGKTPFPLSQSLHDRKVGMVGLGRIGMAIARRLDAMGISLVYHTRNAKPEVSYKHYPRLIDMARDVDVLLLIVPGGSATEKMVDAKVLEALGPNGILINVGRGSVVDEKALVQALKAKTILSAGLDVFADEPHVPKELLEMDHVVLLPHLGSASIHTRDAMAQLVVDNLIAWKAGKPPLTPVPETPFKATRK
jgi:lactate dehydrogenase-like 2-hydroxyacid dehydrogenase